MATTDPSPRRSLRRGIAGLAGIAAVFAVAMLSGAPEASGQQPPRAVDAGPAAPAPAAAPSIEVWQVEAETSDAAVFVDPKLDKGIQAQLKQGPFRQFNSYTLAGRVVLRDLQPNRPVPYTLKNGSTLTLALVSQAGDRSKLHAQVAAAAPTTRAPTNIDFTTGPGNYFFLGPFGPKALFLVITVKK